MRDSDPNYGRIPLRYGPGYGAVFLSSTIISVVVSVATFYALSRYGGPLPNFGGGAAAENISGGEPVRVPDVVGMAAESADELLSARKLRFVVRERRADSSVAPGAVIVQTPLAQSRIEAGGEVEVVVSTGADRLQAPELIGKTLEEAQKTLEAAGLTVAGVLDVDGSDPGKVTAMSPAAGTEVARGASVTLSVARPKVAVPQLLGEHVTDARERIKKAGLSVGDVRERYDRRKRGNLVLTQEPEAGTPVALGTKIDLIVNQGD